MSNRTLTGSIALTKLPQAAIIKKQGKSGEIRGIFLPIEGNHLTEKDGAVYMDIRVLVREEEDQYGQHGFVSKGVPSEVYKAHKDDKEALQSIQPILGNIKDWSGVGSNTAPAAEVDDSEDLPF